jgi:hypothetical protein
VYNHMWFIYIYFFLSKPYFTPDVIGDKIRFRQKKIYIYLYLVYVDLHNTQWGYVVLSYTQNTEFYFHFQ